MNDAALRHRLLSAPLEALTADARQVRDARGPERMTY